MRVPWTARRSNHSILKEISPEYSLESGENEGTSGQAVPHKAPRASPKQPPTSARKAGGKPGGCTSSGGKVGGRGWAREKTPTGAAALGNPGDAPVLAS